MQETVAVFRRFNRLYTRVLGLFSRRLLDSPLTLAEARIVYEVVHEPGISAGELSGRLGMDRGQLSRIVAGLLKQTVLERTGSPGGRRSLPLTATARGRELLERLESAAERQAENLFRNHDRSQLARLRSALCEVESILGREPGADGDPEEEPERREEVLLRNALPGELGWIITRHAEVYGREHGFSGVFEHYVLLGMAECIDRGMERSRIVIAEYRGVPVGSVGLVERSETEAQLRWLLVEAHARGLGVGRKLVQKTMELGRELGYGRIMLWTLGDLEPARRLYQSAGFRLEEQKQGEMGGLPRIEERWAVEL